MADQHDWNVASLRGAAGSLPRSLTWQKMREIAREDRLKEKIASQR